jgi:transcriptional regulator with XRE-family HTH domain
MEGNNPLPLWAHRLRRLRKRKRLTQDELSKLTGLNAVTISQVERGANTTTDTLSRIAEGLGVPLWEVFRPEQDKSPELADFEQQIHEALLLFQTDTVRFLSSGIGDIRARLAEASEGRVNDYFGA